MNTLKDMILTEIEGEWYAVPVGEAEKVKEIVTREMTTALDFGVPLEVGIGIGDNWLEAH